VRLPFVGNNGVVPNGKPGDHPLTDIVVHGLEVFGDSADALIREILDLGGEAELVRRFDLLRLDPRFAAVGTPPEDVDLEALARDLTSFRDELRSQRIDQGWELGNPDGRA
jgi:hypothetical protein